MLLLPGQGGLRRGPEPVPRRDGRAFARRRAEEMPGAGVHERLRDERGRKPRGRNAAAGAAQTREDLGATTMKNTAFLLVLAAACAGAPPSPEPVALAPTKLTAAPPAPVREIPFDAKSWVSEQSNAAECEQ